MNPLPSNHPAQKNLHQLNLPPKSLTLIYSPPNLTHLLNLSFVPQPDELFLLYQPPNFFLFSSPLIYNLIPPPANPTSKLIPHLKSLDPHKFCTESNLPARIFSPIAKHHRIHPNFIDSQLLLSRAKKTPLQISHIQTASSIARLAMDFAISMLQPGITEIQLANQIKHKIFSLGSHDLAFSPIVAFGKNSASPHHQPSTTPYTTQQIALIDLGATIHHFHSDMTRTVLPSSPSPQMIQVATIVKQAYYSGVGAISTNIQAKHIDQIIRHHITAQNMPDYPHSTGHGVGLQIHEYPSISPKSPHRLQPSHVFTLEPAIYLKDKFGYRYENTLHLTSHHVNQLT